MFSNKKKNQKKADKAMFENIALSNEYAGKIEDLGHENVDKLNGLGDLMLQSAEKYKQDNSQAISDASNQIDSDRKAQNAELAAMGFTPSSGSAYLNSNASYARQKASTVADLKNQANTANLQAQNNAVAGASGLYNQAFANLNGALSAGHGLKSSALQQKQNHYQQKADAATGWGDVAQIAARVGAAAVTGGASEAALAGANALG